MKRTILCFIAIFTINTAHAKELFLDSRIKAGTTVEFLTFTEPSQWGSWLQMNLPYPPMRNLQEQVEKAEGVKLKTRGEAHITVVTPVEFWNVLKSKVSMEEINKMAVSLRIQSSDLEVVCLGKGEATLDSRVAKTYFVVVMSKNLIEVRRRINELYISRGGASGSFVPMNYYPHITLGFTDRDLHESDGVIKGSNSCVYPISLQ